ncbi:MAG: DEAD/DEAH box helicase family protein [Actinobacteria bacterium]|nr:DEAD/DEAH box helicase family protein [Actinomycetota bacterium]
MSILKLKFDPELDYQQEAIQAVVDIFTGQVISNGSFSISSNQAGALGINELGHGNVLEIEDEQILKNVHATQERNSIPNVPELQGRNFSIEMETGTGKTYVYLRTIFELHKVYGFTKFIVVVPSIPIREGVLASINAMKDHFTSIYNEPYDAVIYDSKQLGRVRQFATSNKIQILIINIQAFQKDVEDEESSNGIAQSTKSNVINRESDRMSGRRPIEFIQATNPIVILDEPQNMESEKSRQAIERLHPLCTLRYSATHKNPYNLLYRLSPIDAFDRKLVKRIEVASVRAEENLNDAFVSLIGVNNTDNKITAKVKINVGSGSQVSQKTMTIKMGDDLFAKSKSRQEYKDGYIVTNISLVPGNEHIEFANGITLHLNTAIGGFDEDIMKVMLRKTIESHLDKVLAVNKDRGIKVLSLIFVDKVANYRLHHVDGTTSLGKLGVWFEEIFGEVSKKPKYKNLNLPSAEEVHGGYFSKDKKGVEKDTKGSTQDDSSTYELIMRDKERLLSLNEPLQFIFSHSALAEGWDNPNVFQICTLRESASKDRKRQEIGRGLRLPVNQHGERVRDDNVNWLTVVANESYEDFARKLQTEYEDDYGIEFGIVDRIAFSQIPVPNAIPDEKGNVPVVGQVLSEQIYSSLSLDGYINPDGRLSDKYKPHDPNFVLPVDPEFEQIRAPIMDVLDAYVLSSRIKDARHRQRVAFNKEVTLDQGFKELWEKISPRTRYRVEFSSDQLVDDVIRNLKTAPKITPIKLMVDVVKVETNKGGIKADKIIETGSYDTSLPRFLPDILDYLQNETELTRMTLSKILLKSGRLDEFKINPQAFLTMVAHEIRQHLDTLMVEGIRYEKLAGQVWEMHRLESETSHVLECYLDNLYKVRNLNKTPYDYVEFDSKVEKAFAKALDDNKDVKYFLKLPSWFKVDTPVGSYNPDWAIVFEQDARIYLVRETKSTLVAGERRREENIKINCGRRHFEAIDVDYDVVTSLDDMVRRL